MAESLNISTRTKSAYNYLFRKGGTPVKIIEIHNSIRWKLPPLPIHSTIGDQVIKTVRFIGNITRVNHSGKISKYSMGTSLHVNDGTGEIKCLFSREEYSALSNKYEQFLMHFSEINSNIESLDMGDETPDKFLQATSFLLENLSDKYHEHGVVLSDFQVGSEVYVTGNISECFGKKVIYITSIKKLNMEEIKKEKDIKQKNEDYIAILNKGVSENRLYYEEMVFD